MNQKVAFVFPGQGSQSVGMMNNFIPTSSNIKNRFDSASNILGYDLWDLIQYGPAEKLNQTQITQPALLAASVALWDVYFEKENAVKPVIMAGHSLGEFSALVCAGALSFVDAIRLVALRGQSMQEAVPAGQGAMAAVLGLDDQTVIKICEQVSGAAVSAANFNSPGQVVIAGTKEGVNQATELLKTAGAKKILPLSVSVPSHCQLMLPAAQKIEFVLKDIHIQTPTIPVIHNADVIDHRSEETIKKALVRQLTSPVRWVETIQKIQHMGVNTVIECGPGAVLTGLNKRIAPDLNSLTIHTNNGLLITL